MSATPRTFFKIVCDHTGCTCTLGDDEHDYWSIDSLPPLLQGADWLSTWLDEEVENDYWLALPETRHYCIDHWMICEGCDQRFPIATGLWVDEGGGWLCARCKP